MSTRLNEYGRMLLHLIPRPSSTHAAAARLQGCTCDPRFFPAACDADCPHHGLQTFLQERLGIDAERGGDDT